ncbi:MAG: hypothetical protein ACK4M7_05885, partial [Burkholderiales bacterium]
MNNGCITSSTVVNSTYSHTPKVQALKLHEDAVLPKRAHHTDAGADLYSCESLTLNPGESALVNTGIGVKIPVGY